MCPDSAFTGQKFKGSSPTGNLKAELFKQRNIHYFQYIKQGPKLVSAVGKTRKESDRPGSLSGPGPVLRRRGPSVFRGPSPYHGLLSELPGPVPGRTTGGGQDLGLHHQTSHRIRSHLRTSGGCDDPLGPGVGHAVVLEIKTPACTGLDYRPGQLSHSG